MLNLSQRLTLAFVLVLALFAAVVIAARHALAAAGLSGLAGALLAAAVVIAGAAIYFVLAPIRLVAGDARRIAQGNLEHRVDWSSHDDFGEIAIELNRLAVR